MENLKVVKFSPNIAKLTTAVKVSKKLVMTDLRDIKQFEVIKKSRIDLRAMEIEIEKTGKSFRQSARDYADRVIAEEKELKSITSPEIERLKEIENEVKEIFAKDLRLKALPERKERLAKINDGIEITDEELLQLDDDQFNTYENQRIADKNENDRIENERKIREDQEKLDKDRLELEKQKREIEEEKERKEYQEAADKRAKEEADRRKEIEEKERVAQEKEDQRKLKRKKAYIKFLEDNGYTEENKDEFFQKKYPDRVVLYKKVGEFNL